uniref:Carboxylic ester hydrolase n=1 Tax=Salarias fasciatus TaxID=181472 RepID=A0A672G0R3_SALFA
MWRKSKYDQKVSEDCLYLNIFVPLDVNFDPPVRTLLPVMVWIHGGDFIAGSASKPLYDGRFISNFTNTVVVSLEYRLGAFGFLLSGKDPHASALGNYGLQDQQAALLWVQQNIAAFGGDPSKVTIFGESAGAQSVSLHLMIQSSKPLFQQAVLQSQSGEAFKDSSACRSSAFWLQSFTFRAGRKTKVPSEKSDWSQENKWSMIGIHQSKLLTFVWNCFQIVTDYIFLCPSRRAARAGTAAGSGVWMYVFDHVPADRRVWSGLTFCYQHACHGAELPFLFNSASVANFTFSPPEKLLSNRMLCYWGAFAHAGNPSSRAQQTAFCREQRLPPWPRYADTSGWIARSDNEPVLMEERTACYCDISELFPVVYEKDSFNRFDLFMDVKTRQRHCITWKAEGDLFTFLKM